MKGISHGLSWSTVDDNVVVLVITAISVVDVVLFGLFVLLVR